MMTCVGSIVGLTKEAVCIPLAGTYIWYLHYNCIHIVTR